MKTTAWYRYAMQFVIILLLLYRYNILYFLNNICGHKYYLPPLCFVYTEPEEALLDFLRIRLHEQIHNKGEGQKKSIYVEHSFYYIIIFATSYISYILYVCVFYIQMYTIH